MLRSRKYLVLLAAVCALTLSLPLFASAAPSAISNPNPTQYVNAPILYRVRVEPSDHYAVKDPTLVDSGGRHPMVDTGANASGRWQMPYPSSTTLGGFRAVTHMYLSRVGESYFAAPEVFYFEPRRSADKSV